MKTIKIGIIDDEELGRNALKMTISKFCPFVELIGEANNVKDAIDLINTEQPEIILLDIDLGDGTGFDVLRSVKIPPKTIFVTAHNDFAIKAFQFNAIDYLLKPFNPLDLVEAIAKTTKLLDTLDHNLPEKTLNENIDSKLNKIVVPSNNGFEVVDLNDLLYLQADNNYTIIYMLNGTKKVISKTLKHYEDLLQNKHFFRCHQTYLINTNYIREYIKGEGGSIILQGNVEIDVSRRKKEELLNLIQNRFIK